MNKTCPDCNGRGYTDYGDCDTCAGEGEVYISKAAQYEETDEGHRPTA
ncbi:MULTISPECIES: hypothetical protein [Paenibacillus]|nr:MULTISPECIES: hypothetical protein [Paenibacillus]